MAVHESQSRFYENIIGKSREFSNYLYKEAIKQFNEQFDGVSEEEFYKALNKVTPSLIRTEADELTYSLHIIIRYEIEKLLNAKVNLKIWVKVRKEWRDNNLLLKELGYKKLK